MQTFLKQVKFLNDFSVFQNFPGFRLVSYEINCKRKNGNKKGQSMPLSTL